MVLALGGVDRHDPIGERRGRPGVRFHLDAADGRLLAPDAIDAHPEELRLPRLLQPEEAEHPPLEARAGLLEVAPAFAIVAHLPDVVAWSVPQDGVVVAQDLVDRPHDPDFRVAHLPPPRGLTGFPFPQVAGRDRDSGLRREPTSSLEATAKGSSPKAMAKEKTMWHEKTTVRSMGGAFYQDRV
jgi:hypothetical protein